MIYSHWFTYFSAQVEFKVPASREYYFGNSSFTLLSNNRCSTNVSSLFFFVVFPKCWPNLAIPGEARFYPVVTNDTALRWSFLQVPSFSSRFKSHVIHKTFSDCPCQKLTPFSKVLTNVLSNHIFDMNTLSWTINYLVILNPYLDKCYSLN